MFRALPLLVLLLLMPPLHASCQGNVYHLAPGRETELLTLTALDLNPEAKGAQGSVAVPPLRRIQGSIGWRFGELASGKVEVGLFGNWSEDELARIYSGSAMPEQSVTSEFAFFAPAEPGSYALVVKFRFADACALAYARANLRVVNTSPALYVEITSPKERFHEIGEPVVVDALLTPGARAAVYINGSLVGEVLPYSWETSNLTPGRYPLLVNVSLANMSASAQVEVVLVNRSTAPAGFEILPPPGVEGLEATSQGILAVAGNGLYLLAHSGELLGRIKTSSPPLVSASGDGFVLAEGGGVSLYRGAARVWNATLPAKVELLAASPRGAAFVAGGELYLFNPAGALLWRKQLGFKPALLELSNSSIALARDGGVYLLSYEGSPLWNASLETRVMGIASSGDSHFLLLGDELLALAQGGALWNLSLGYNATMIEASSLGVLVASQEVVELYTREGELKWRLYPERGVQDIALASEAALVLSGGRILSIPLEEAKPVPELGRALPILLLVLASLALMLVLKRRPEGEERREETREEELPMRVVVTSKGGIAVAGAAVRLGDVLSTTNTSGVASFRLKPGSYGMRVEKEGFKPLEAELTLEGEGKEVEVELEPLGKLAPEQEALLGELRRALEQAYERVAERDPCLPAFFRGLGYEIVRGAEALALSREFGNAPISAAEFAVPLVCEAMQDWKNVALYSASSRRSAAGCEAPPFRAMAAVEFLRGSRDAEELERELLRVDGLITSKIGEVSIHPPASLWQISRGLFERGRSSSREEASVLFAFSHYLLSCVEHMLSSEELLLRLRGSIV